MRRLRHLASWIVGAAAVFASSLAGLAQGPVSGCAVVAGRPNPLIHRAAVKPGAGEVSITYAGHSTFLIESPAGTTAATDYNDYVRPPVAPNIVTMNHAHSTHFTDFPDPNIKHVLRGWDREGEQARHDVTYQDMRVRNVVTNIRDPRGGTEYAGNSIFVYEAAGLCIAHLGHLHHTLVPEKLAEIGKVDVVLAPVDGSWTLDQAGMLEVLAELKAPLVIPMHYFSQSTLDRFIARAAGQFTVTRSDSSSVVLSKATLPEKPTLLVLQGR